MFSSNFNKGLYGPTRTSARTEIKDDLLRDHVLQNGEWHGDDRQKNPWKTSFSISFEVGFSHVSVITFLESVVFFLRSISCSSDCKDLEM